MLARMRIHDRWGPRVRLYRRHQELAVEGSMH